jgi:hypothetical protein
MPRGPVQGPGFSPGGGQSGRPGVAGGPTGQKSFEQPAPDRDQENARRRPAKTPKPEPRPDRKA